MQFRDAYILEGVRRRRSRRARRAVAQALRCAAAALMVLAGLPLWLGRQMMRAGGRANGMAYEVERDR